MIWSEIKVVKKLNGWFMGNRLASGDLYARLPPTK